MKKLSLIVVTLLMFAGCSSKNEPVIENNESNSNSQSEVKEIPENDSIKDAGITSNIEDIDNHRESVKLSEENLNVVLFDFNKYSLTENTEINVDDNIKKLEDKNFNSIKVEGNCDEWGSDEYNFALGLKRANSVKKYMIDNGIESNKITIISNGETNPVCTEKTKECWRENRRVETIIK